MVVIRLARAGSVHRPFYHVVVADQRAKRDGKFIERLGYLNYFASEAEAPAKIDEKRLAYWLGQGAVARPSVRKLIRRLKRQPQAPAADIAAAGSEAPQQDSAPNAPASGSEAPKQEPAANDGAHGQGDKSA